MKTLFCLFFSIVYFIIAYFGEHPSTALIISQVWLVGGIISIGDKK